MESVDILVSQLHEKLCTFVWNFIGSIYKTWENYFWVTLDLPIRLWFLLPFIWFFFYIFQ